METRLIPLLSQLQLQPHECQGKRIVVTGAGRGIGLQIARAFAALGGEVFVAEHDAELGQAAESMICAEGGLAHFYPVDVSSSESVTRLREQIEQKAGPVEYLINNAIVSPVMRVVDMPVEVWDQVLSVNLRGTFLTCRAFLPSMITHQKGVILNLISTDAMPGLSAYIASKQGILGFTQSLAVELDGTPVKVIPFAPGMVDTPGIREVSANLAPHLAITQEQFLSVSLHPAYDGLMPPEHAAVAAVYLALRLADQYHGTAVNGYEILEAAGLLSATVAAQEALAPENGSTAAVSKSQMDCLKAVSSVLQDTAAEFSKLPIFARPLARNGFRQKSGRSLESWQQYLTHLIERGSTISSGESQTLLADLPKLETYYQGVPAETARFVKDQAVLTEIRETCARRIAALRALANTLK